MMNEFTQEMLAQACISQHESYKPTRREYFAAAALTGIWAYPGGVDGGAVEQVALNSSDKIIKLLDKKEAEKNDSE